MRNTQRHSALESESFFPNRVGVWQVGTVLYSRQSVTTNDGVDLSLHLFRNLWKDKHGVEEHVDRSRRL